MRLELLIISVVVNGVLAAPFLAMLKVIVSDGRIMRGHRNRWWSDVVGWFTVALTAGGRPAAHHHAPKPGSPWTML